MIKKYRFLILFVILGTYSFLFIATKYVSPCEGDCALVGGVDSLLRKNRPYVYGVYRCSRMLVSDTLCVNVFDTPGIDWDALADTTCIYAATQGLYQQKIFVIKYENGRYDTLSRKQCP